jgi:hypothetical protein
MTFLNNDTNNTIIFCSNLVIQKQNSNKNETQFGMRVILIVKPMLYILNYMLHQNKKMPFKKIILFWCCLHYIYYANYIHMPYITHEKGIL